MALQDLIPGMTQAATEQTVEKVSWFAQEIAVSKGTIIWVSCGWALAVLLLFFLFLVFTSTPAWTFMRAKMKRSPVIDIATRDGVSRFRVADISIAGVGQVKGFGPFFLTEKSARREYKSGVALYSAFGEYAATIPLSFAAIVQNIRASATSMWSFKEFKDEIKKVTKPIKLMPFTTISMHELSSMFPFNMTPAAIENYGIQIKNKLEATRPFNATLLIVGAIAIFILIIAVIALKIFMGDDPVAPVSVICQYPEATQAIVNASRIISNNSSVFI